MHLAKLSKIFLGSMMAFVLCLVTTTANADSVTYTTNFATDGGVPASASAVFTVNASGQLVVVLSDTTVNPWQDSQNLGAISFQLQNSGSSTFLTGTLTSISGNSISSTPLNTNITSLITVGGASMATTSWSNTVPKGTAVPTGANYTAYFAVGPHSIVGAPNSSNQYTAGTCSTKLGANGGCGSSKEFGQNSTDNPMIFETATFVFSLSGTAAGSLKDVSMCSTGQTCISNVTFGFGPDGPDADDVSKGALTTSTTPEPGSLVLLGSGLVGVAGFLRRRLRGDYGSTGAV